MKLVAQSIAVRTWLEVPAKEISVQGSKGTVEIKPSHIGLGYRPLRLLLLSHKWREGQVSCGVHVSIYKSSVYVQCI